MEDHEYATLFAQEEEYFWYRGLRRLVEQQAALALGRRAGRRTTATGGPGTSRSEGARILDAGCGTGGMLARLARQGAPTGLDFSATALRFARRRTGAPLLRGSVERLPFRDEAFDLIVSLDVLYHRAVASDLEALREFRRCLRPGGTLILNLPAFESLRSSHDAAIHTARRYRRGPLRALLGSAGLETARVTYWNTLLFPALAAVRLRRRSQARPVSDLTTLPGPLNRLLAAILDLERAWLRTADLPFGLSLLVVARRPGDR